MMIGAVGQCLVIYYTVFGLLWIISMSLRIPSMLILMHWPTKCHQLRIICGFSHVSYLTQMRAHPLCRVRNTTPSWLGDSITTLHPSSFCIERQLSLVSPMIPLGKLATTIPTTGSFLLLTGSGYVYSLC